MEWTRENTAAIGRIPSGLFIVTAGGRQGVDGYLASWIQQVSFSPLLISMAIKPGRPCYDYILQHGALTVNIMGRKGSAVLKHFWRGYDPLNNPFSSLDHQWAEQGGVILKQAMAVLECSVREICKPGDHEVLFAEVLRCQVLDPTDENMIHVRKSGLEY